MQKIMLILCLSFVCCNSEKDTENLNISKKDTGRLNIDKNNISSIWINCQKQKYESFIEAKPYKVEIKEYEKIVAEINSAKNGRLPDSTQKCEYIEGNNIETISFVLKSGDTIDLAFLRGSFIWQDYMYTTDLNISYYGTNLCMRCAIKELPIDSLWNMLAFIKFGCLVGGQNVINGSFGGEGCILTSSPFWKEFFKRPKEELTPFLINKFPSRKETDIHVCPFEKAYEGELSVYCLHKIYMKNWYDFEVFKEFKDKEITGRMNSEQMWLRKILKNEKQRTILKELWLNEMNKK